MPKPKIKIKKITPKIKEIKSTDETLEEEIEESEKQEFREFISESSTSNKSISATLETGQDSQTLESNITNRPTPNSTSSNENKPGISYGRSQSQEKGDVYD